MPAVSRISDMTCGHCFFPVPVLDGAPNVFANGMAVAFIGSKFPEHKCGKSVHKGVLAKGSSTVFANGRAVSRIGDQLSCGDRMAKGSPTVFVG